MGPVPGFKNHSGASIIGVRASFSEGARKDRRSGRWLSFGLTVDMMGVDQGLDDNFVKKDGPSPRSGSIEWNGRYTGS